MTGDGLVDWRNHQAGGVLKSLAQPGHVSTLLCASLPLSVK